jgi:hypothetical protein
MAKKFMGNKFSSKVPSTIHIRKARNTHCSSFVSTADKLTADLTEDQAHNPCILTICLPKDQWLQPLGATQVFYNEQAFSKQTAGSSHITSVCRYWPIPFGALVAIMLYLCTLGLPIL